MATKPTEFTASSLSVELRMDRRKVGQLLEGLEPHRKDDRGSYYYLRDVFDHINSRSQAAGQLDPEQEQAKLAEARRHKLELETRVLRGELIYLDQAAKMWADHITNCKTRLRAIPHKTAHRVMAATEHADGLRLLQNEIEEALNELAGIEVVESDEDLLGDGEEGVESSAETDGFAVG